MMIVRMKIPCMTSQFLYIHFQNSKSTVDALSVAHLSFNHVRAFSFSLCCNTSIKSIQMLATIWFDLSIHWSERKSKSSYFYCEVEMSLFSLCKVSNNISCAINVEYIFFLYTKQKLFIIHVECFKSLGFISCWYY